MTRQQRTVQDILADEELESIYVVAIYPTWKHAHPTELPEPLAAWLSTHCPGIKIEMTTILSGTPQFHATEDTRYLDGTFLPHPMFSLLGLSREQADQFAQHWEVATDSARDDFLFLEVTRAGTTPPSPTDEDMRACIEDVWRHFQGDRAAR